MSQEQQKALLEKRNKANADSRAIVDAAIEASTDGAAAIAATESACLKLAPILLARR